jgi:uncharacterized protein
MNIWVDADACPVIIKNILYKAAERARILVKFVANQPINIPRSAYLQLVLVGSGFDVADNEIVKRLSPGDLVITADIPLAADVIAKGGHALNPRGEMYTTDSIEARLTMRNFMETLRSSGIQTKGPDTLTPENRKAFADQLDRFITKMR